LRFYVSAVGAPIEFVEALVEVFLEAEGRAVRAGVFGVFAVGACYRLNFVSEKRINAAQYGIACIANRLEGAVDGNGQTKIERRNV